MGRKNEPLGVPDSADMLRKRERNAFYESLSPSARERFLERLEDGVKRGLDEETAWREAVVAAETTYPGERLD